MFKAKNDDDDDIDAVSEMRNFLMFFFYFRNFLKYQSIDVNVSMIKFSSQKLKNIIKTSHHDPRMFVFT
jgi:hypothetical protein